jgi:hypothetical protein
VSRREISERFIEQAVHLNPGFIPLHGLIYFLLLMIFEVGKLITINKGITVTYMKEIGKSITKSLAGIFSKTRDVFRETVWAFLVEAAVF